MYTHRHLHTQNLQTQTFADTDTCLQTFAHGHLHTQTFAHTVLKGGPGYHGKLQVQTLLTDFQFLVNACVCLQGVTKCCACAARTAEKVSHAISGALPDAP